MGHKTQAPPLAGHQTQSMLITVLCLGIIGLLTYALASNHKVATIGLVAFAIALFAIVTGPGGHAILRLP